MKQTLKITLILLLSSLFLVACRSRKKVAESFNFKESSMVKTDTNIVKATAEIAQVKSIQKTNQESVKKDNEGSVKIKGKTDSTNNKFTYNNVIGGDTLTINITGNADFEISNSWENRTERKATEVVTENLDIIQEYARKSVAQETITKVATKVKSTETQVKEKGFTFGAWFTWLLWGIVIICGVWLFYYFGGRINWKSIIEKLRNGFIR